MEEVKGQQDARDPEAAHGTKIEPVGPRVPVVLRHHDADEADDVHQLLQRAETVDEWPEIKERRKRVAVP